MRIATWNVNSLKARLPRVEQWIAEHQPDILVMQETKLADAVFPHGTFELLGYESAHHGDGRWNGVAIVSRVGIADVRSGFSDGAPDDEEERRMIAASCGGVRVISVYVPNGRSVGSEHYVSKLDWLGRLRAELERSYSPDEPLALLGDFNVAPEDRDVWDIAQFAGMTHVTEPERSAVRHLVDWGLTDAMRVAHPDEEGLFTWWDYRAGNFHKGFGMRIDLALVSSPLAARLEGCWRDREARKGPGPSDHAPVVVDLFEEGTVDQ